MSRAQAAHYTVIYSSQITSGAYSGDYDIFRSGFAADGLVDGAPDQPKPIASQRYRELDPVAIGDNDDGYFLAYMVEHSDSAHLGDRDIVMRHIDHNGSDLWGDTVNHFVVIAQSKYAEENPVIQILDDGSLMVFYEIHYGSAPNADIDIAAVRLGRNGALLWPQGVLVASSKKQEVLRGSVGDARGGAIVLIESVSHRDSTVIASDVLGQHVDSVGTIGWKDSKEPLKIAGSSHLERNPAMVSDGSGGAYVAYEIEYVGGARDGDVDILAQHLSSAGTREWTSETDLPVVSSNPKAREERPVVVRDSNGITIAFEVSFPVGKGGKTTAHVIGMQRLDTNARPLWNLGKKSKLMGLRHDIPEHPRLIVDPVGGVYVLFEGVDTVSGNRDIYAQRVDRDGDQIWGDGEIPQPIFNTPDVERDPVAMIESDGSLIVAAVRSMPGDQGMQGYRQIVAQRVAMDGTLPWTAQLTAPIVLTTGTFNNSAPLLLRAQ
jgi:hypothetical protein